MLKKQKPAPVARAPASKSSQHHQRELDIEAEGPRLAPCFPAELCPPPIEDDRAFFVMNPGVTERLRLPFQTEFEPDVLSVLGRTIMIRAVVHRDPITRKPTIWRTVLHIEGGCA